KGGTVTIEFEYEKIHKRCFHCLRLSHEKAKCPYIKRGANRTQQAVEPARVEKRGPTISEPLSGPPGFPVLFPELSGEDRKMAMLYISHADPTERLARIERVRQGIADNLASSSVHLTRITKELDKGKGHVYSYMELLASQQGGTSLQIAAPLNIGGDRSEKESESSDSMSSAFSAPIAQMGFQLGPSSEGRVTGSSGANRGQRRRLHSWRRKVAGKDLNAPALPALRNEEETSLNSKRKAVRSLFVTEDANSILNMKVERHKPATLLWGFTSHGNYSSQSDQNPILNLDLATAHPIIWQAPPLGMIKCNIGVSWLHQFKITAIDGVEPRLCPSCKKLHSFENCSKRHFRAPLPILYRKGWTFMATSGDC
ncbi:hypothetical protein HID58_016170, partial [Brassica napus]